MTYYINDELRKLEQVIDDTFHKMKAISEKVGKPISFVIGPSDQQIYYYPKNKNIIGYSELLEMIIENKISEEKIPALKKLISKYKELRDNDRYTNYKFDITDLELVETDDDCDDDHEHRGWCTSSDMC